MRWLVAIVLCWAAAPRASAQPPLVVQTLNNTRIDKLAIVHEQLWAAGEGSVFIYKNSKWVAPFKSNGQGEAYAIGAVTTVSANRTIMRDNASTNLGIICFGRDRGLCSVYDPQTNRSFVLDENQARDFAAPGALLSLLQDHARGSPLMMAVNQNTTPVNEVPLQLVELSNEEYLARTKSDAVKLSLKPYTADSRKKIDQFSIRFRGWKSYFPPVHHLYSFQHNGFVYIVTVQPAVDSETFRYDTRIARFCLRDDTMTTYTEIPVRCKTSHHTFEVAVHARMVNHKNRFLLFMSMGNTDPGERYSKDKSAICVFDIEELDKKFEDTINECNSGAPEVGVRKIKYYQYTTRSNAPLACERLDRRIEFCSGNRENKFIISMTEYEGEVVYVANVRKVPQDVTYIYGATRTQSAPVGVLTAFEIDPPGSPTSDEPLYIWATDDRGRLHRILYLSKIYNNSESMLLVTVNRPVAKDGFAIESAQYNNRTMFVVDKTIIEIHSPDPCSLYLNCGDCLNPRALTHKIVSCVWENDRCVHSTNETKADNAFCKPSILEKAPFNGPQRGGTRFRIKGFDLGDQESARVMFGSQRCKILTWDNMTGICEVPPDRDSKTKVDISLYVADHRHDARMKTFPIGTDGPVNLGTFTYYSVEFYGVHPSFGPRKGGTQLRVVGQNIGQSGPLAQYGLIGSISNMEHVICKDFVLRNESELWCNTTEYFGPDLDRVNSFNLVLKIDGVAYAAVEKPDSSQLFVYQPNPTGIKVHPETKTDFFAKGSSSYPIVFTGEHLDSAAFPKIQLKLLGYSGHIEESCIANSTCMKCRVPALSDKIILDQALPATTTLKIDNFRFEDPSLRITYHPNATIILNDGEKFVIDSEGPSKISIRGKNLRALDKEDLRITVNDHLCSIGDIQDSSVECYSEPLTAGEYSIQVEVAGKKYSALMSTIVTAGRGLGGAATAAIVIGSLIVLVGLTFLFWRYAPLRKKIIEEPKVTYTPENDGYLRPDNDRNAASDNERLLPTIPPDPDIINLLAEEGLLMDFSCIQVGVLIGRGQFGCVYRGILKRDKLSEEEPVAVKTLQQRGLTSNDANVFLKEALRMKDFDHQNVLRLIGVSFDNNNSTDPMIIVPYMANGDLLTYIRNQDNKPTVKDLITFGANIALGMSYLTTQKFVHRDLAARNCMLGSDLIVRVADFGLSRDVYETSYYSSDNTKTKLPVKWMAIESLRQGVYSHKSDVWSYGVVLWELMTRGCVPLPDVDNWEVQNWLISGRRMLQPTFCPDALYQIMMACWDEDPKKRPTFSKLVKDVPNVIHTIELASRNRIPNYVNV